MLMRSGESATLERWRLAKAKLAEIELEEKVGTLLILDDVLEWANMMAHVMRGVGERLQRSFGQAAADVLNEGIDDLDRICEVRFGGEGSKPPPSSVPLPKFQAPHPAAGPICPRCGYKAETTPGVIQSELDKAGT